MGHSALRMWGVLAAIVSLTILTNPGSAACGSSPAGCTPTIDKSTSPPTRSKVKKARRSSTQNRSAQKASSVKAPAKRAALEPYKAAIVMNAHTGEVIFQANPHRKLVPASLTKMMLALVTMERLRRGALGLAHEVRASDQACDVGGSQIYLHPGETLTLEEMLEAVLIRSANDAAASVAEHVAGSQEKFVELMNARAEKLGMRDTVFWNVHGLPSSNGHDNLSTAYDMALLAKELVKYPEILDWSSKSVASIREGQYTIHTTNKLLGFFEGLDGLKTGFVRKAGFSMAATAKREEKRLIAVVLGSPSSLARFNATKDLLSKGFDRYQGSVSNASDNKSPGQSLQSGSSSSSSRPSAQKRNGSKNGSHS